MPGPILETTRQSDLQPLVANGVRVIQTVGQIRTELRNKLGAEHAALLAEPNADPDSGDIQWFAPVGGSVIRLTELSGPQLAAARTKIAQIVTDITAHAEKLKSSPNQTTRLMANNLALAIEIPDETHIFMVGDQPVLAGWGHVPTGPAAPLRLLETLAHEVAAEQARATAPEPPVQEAKSSAAERHDPPLTTSPAAAIPSPAPGRYRLEGSGTTLASVPAVVGRTAWPSALLWLLFVLLLLAIAYLLLKNCALGWPGAPDGLRSTFLNFCEARTLVTHVAPPDDGEQARLLDQLAQLDLQLRNKRSQCVAQQRPEPPRSQDIIQQRGGKIGAVNVILRWDHADDLDLHVRCPDGAEIYYNKKTGCGGTLDVDANAGSPIANPAENITWPRETAPAGEYLVEVNRFANRMSAPSASFSVELLIDGERAEIHRQSIDSGQKRVFTFKLPYVRQGSENRRATP